MTRSERIPTAMAREIAEIPSAAERLLSSRQALIAAACRIADFDPRFVVICGRGSSGHVGVFLRYLFEVRAGLLVSAAAPSVVTAYRQAHDLRQILFVVISQSGRSPDLVMATRQARESGALTVALVNDVASPAASAAELVVPLEAGSEQSVAATKTVALSMLRSAELVAELRGDVDLSTRIRRMPARFAAALTCDWSPWGERLASARAAFVTGRGFGLGTAREIALKLAETMRLPALGYSAAELRHGPFAAIASATPVLALRLNDETGGVVDELIHQLEQQRRAIFSAGGAYGSLPWIGDDDPVCDAIAMLLPAYAAIERASRRQGFDPDAPPNLSKVTETL